MIPHSTAAAYDRTGPRSPRRARTGGLAAIAVLAAVLSLGAAHACAAMPAVLSVQSLALPSDFSANDAATCKDGSGCDAYFLTIRNVGNTPATLPLTITDHLPAGIGFVNVIGEEQEPNRKKESAPDCSIAGSVLTCHFTTGESESGNFAPGATLGFRVEVIATGPTAAVLTNHVEVTAPGTPTVTTASSNPFDGLTAPFAVQEFSSSILSEAGTPESRAGAHPAGNTTTLNWSTFLEPNPGLANEDDLPVLEPKTQIVDLPPGFVADARALGACPIADVSGTRQYGGRFNCPADSQVGWLDLEVPTVAQLVPVFNVAPEPGYPAEFAFEYVNTIVPLLPRLLPSSQGYVLSVSAPYLPRVHAFKITGASLSLFGDPTEANGAGNGEAFFTNPDDCSAKPLNARVELDSWVHPEQWVSAETPMFEASASHALSGCSALIFQPSLLLTPSTTQADTPSGQEIDIRVPQAPNTPGTLATPDLKDAVVTLPEGVSIDPSAANGLQACQAAGPEGIELGAQDRLADENRVEEGEERGADGLVHPAAGHCPAASQVGEVEVITPLLEEHLKGHVYVAAPRCGNEGQPQCTSQSAEDGELFGLYLEVAGSGIIVKLRGEVSVDPATGRVTTRFDENPQLPFSELKLKLNDGPRAPLANPQSCATPATTLADFTPWSTPYTPDATPSSSFAVTGCTGGFAPGFSAGTTDTTAGRYSPFTVTFSRRDGEQDLSGLTVSMPPGLVGRIAGIAECGEAEVAAAEANTGSCPAASRVGTATAAAGAGATPFYQSGPVYLTGPYDGAPFGLAVVVQANAGPFHLGNIVVRARIQINPETAAVTVVLNPLPEMIDGVPLRLQLDSATVGGEGTPFTFNPTSCNEQSINATITSTQGTQAAVSTPYGIQGCKELPFHPSFTVSTQGTTSRSNGASLDVRIATKQGPDVRAGEEEANIRKVDVQLPIDLPSRLTTLQKACTERQFATNPAGCPEASFVGSAVAHTPLLPVPLEGPAILVSHGGAAFPNLELILQGDGVLVDLTGNTQITKGITYSKFETAPDAPISSFELKLPEGKYSALAANGNLCRQKLIMPTAFTGQNGAVINQDTHIEVTGCPNTISILSHSVKKHTLKLSVYGPASGKLTASGKGVSSQTKSYSGQEALTFTLRQKKAGKLSTKIKLIFTPKSGKKLSKSLTVKFKQ